MTIYNQNDYLDTILGNNPADRNSKGLLVWSIMYVGCLVTTLCNVLPKFGINLDPIQMNDTLKAAGLYGADNGFLDIQNLNKAFDNLDVQILGGFAMSNAEKALANPHQAVILGLYLPNGQTHYVALKDIQTIIDPNGGVERNRNFYGADNKFFSTIIISDINSMIWGQIHQYFLDKPADPSVGYDEATRNALIDAASESRHDLDYILQFSGLKVREYDAGKDRIIAQLNQQIQDLQKQLETKPTVQTITVPTVSVDSLAKPQSVDPTPTVEYKENPGHPPIAQPGQGDHLVFPPMLLPGQGDILAQIKGEVKKVDVNKLTGFLSIAKSGLTSATVLLVGQGLITGDQAAKIESWGGAAIALGLAILAEIAKQKNQ